MPKRVDRAARRAELAAALWRVVARDGIHGASVRAVAAEAGWSPGALQHYFSSWTDLLLFAIDAAAEAAITRIAAIDPALPPRAAALALLEQLLPLDPQRALEAEVWLALISRPPRETEVVSRNREINLGLQYAATLVIERLIAAGLVAPHRDASTEARRLHALLDGLCLHLLARPPLITAVQAGEILSLYLDDLAR